MYVKRTISTVNYITFLYYTNSIFNEVYQETSFKGKSVKEGFDNMVLSEDEKAYLKDKLKKAFIEIFTMLDKIVAGSMGFDSALTLSTSATVNAGSFVAGNDYTILTVGTTDFTLIGASANTVGVSFTATGVGTGTETAKLTPYCYYANVLDNELARDITLQNVDEAINRAMVEYILSEWYLLKGMEEAKVHRQNYLNQMAVINENSVVLRVLV